MYFVMSNSGLRRMRGAFAAMPTRSGLLRRAVASSLLIAVLSALVPAARAQDSVQEVRKAAQAALAQGAYADAIGYLVQLIDWFKESKTPAIVAELEAVYYNLGLCHLLLGQFGESRAAFEEYLKRYGRGFRGAEVTAFIGDSLRYEKKWQDALAVYRKALRDYRAEYMRNPDLWVDVLVSVVRCLLAEEKWKEAEPTLIQIFRFAPDYHRRNWAASLLTIYYLNERQLENVYRLMPMLLQPDSFAARSVALNMTALQTGDDLFADEKYRDALWIYRLVYPHDTLQMNAERQIEILQRRVEMFQRTPGMIRQLLRTQESVAEAEAELEALKKIPNYDPELFFRIARAYMEIRRYREASEFFYDLYQDGPRDRAEECLYLSFHSATKFQPTTKAFARGHEYLDRYPGGKWYDPVSLKVGQMYANVKDWPKVIEVLAKALEVSPKHESIVEVLFLLGYASFMEEKFEDAIGHFVRMNTDYPGNEREPDGHYWTGMSFLFDKQYLEGLPYFERVIRDFPDTMYVEDATFRAGSCEYGASLFPEAQTRLLGFVRRYPESKLLGEAFLTLGDISGALGELREAVAFYEKAIEHQEDLHIEFYNHAYFQSAQIMKDLAGARRGENRTEWLERIISHFRRYIEANREGSNLAMAIYWVGSTYWDLGDQERALAYYRRAIEEYGADRKELGIDLIFEDWVGRAKAAERDIAQTAWKSMRELLSDALKSGRQALALRIMRMLFFDPSASDVEKATFQRVLVRPESVPHASAGVLETILIEADRAGNRALAAQAAEETIREFTETSYALSARMLLARYAVEANDAPKAILHLNIVREVYATSPEAAEALLMLGRLYLQQRELEKADAAFRDVLGVKEWRQHWPEATFRRGEVAVANRKYETAAAYFERIYVLYSGHRQWAAKAYLERARCLSRMFEHRKAQETLQELIGSPDFAGMPEVEEAKDLLERLRQRAG